jgi:hypothetical protein
LDVMGELCGGSEMRVWCGRGDQVIYYLKHDGVQEAFELLKGGPIIFRRIGVSDPHIFRRIRVSDPLYQHGPALPFQSPAPITSVLFCSKAASSWFPCLLVSAFLCPL